MDEFEGAFSKGPGSSALVEVARAATEGRIATLLVHADRHIPGRIDESTGAVALDDSAHPTTDDLLDDVGEMVLRMGGQVIVVPSDRMPTKTGLAAIYRY